MGGWILIGFARYRVYFRGVNALLAHTKFGSLYAFRDDEFLRLDEMLRRRYLTKQSPDMAVAVVIDVAATRGWPQLPRPKGSFAAATVCPASLTSADLSDCWRPGPRGRPAEFVAA